ncbi:hypothetical protein KC345_g56 [Hortaea werneckii]|nr:hypothetical protein KC345_g56 [Hortaea werneckii]
MRVIENGYRVWSRIFAAERSECGERPHAPGVPAPPSACDCSSATYRFRMRRCGRVVAGLALRQGTVGRWAYGCVHRPHAGAWYAAGSSGGGSRSAWVMPAAAMSRAANAASFDWSTGVVGTSSRY